MVTGTCICYFETLGDAHLTDLTFCLQLAMYKDRYEEFQSTINRSNDMFQKFKTEMEKVCLILCIE